MDVASVVLAAGRGTRMVGYGGCKALLPLLPSERSIYEGERPFILEILEQLPPGPKAVVIHHDGEKLRATLNHYLPQDSMPVLVWQPDLNGTGGAVLAATPFLQSIKSHLCLITMADVPLISRRTYENLVSKVFESPGMAGAVLTFRPYDRAQYGCLIIKGEKVIEIVEWKYWKDFDEEERHALELCNAGVYVFRRDLLLEYLTELAQKPHVVQKTIDGKLVNFEEFFLPDLIAIMARNGLDITFLEADENEVLGVDTPQQLEKAQEIYRKRMK